MNEQSGYILVIDGNQDICDVITIAFNDAGYRSIAANTSSLALSILRDNAPDLAVIDAGMPLVSGFALAERAVHQNVPVLMMSASPETCLRMEAADCPYLRKPFRLTTLIAEAEKALAARAENIRRIMDCLAKLKT
jgi:DNA-binding response OmpR family regulator